MQWHFKKRQDLTPLRSTPTQGRKGVKGMCKAKLVMRDALKVVKLLTEMQLAALVFAQGGKLVVCHPV